MSVLSWNCRGMAAAATVRELKNLCRAHQPSILFLMETRANEERVSRTRRMLKFTHVFWVEPMGLSGGLGLFWNDSVNIQVLYSSPNVIHTTVTFNDIGVWYDCSFVYGNPNYQLRRTFWQRLLGLQNDISRPWCCIGDCNEILNQHEKDGLRSQLRGRMDNFRQFVNQAGLMDMDLKGCKFTWVSNPRNGFVTREKLDRVLVNWEWRMVFPHAIAEALPIISSDHAPILLTVQPRGRSARQFKYEAFWENHEDCKNVVQQGWIKGSVEGSVWRTLMNRTKTCRKELMGWQFVAFKNAETEIRKCKEKLSDILNRAHRDIDWGVVKELQKNIDELWKQEEAYWGQRSRVRWLQEGDRNTSFFHASTVQRRERNRIVRIKDSEGRWIEGHDEVMAAIHSFYKDVYKAEEYSGNYEMLEDIPHLVTLDMKESLAAEVKEDDIREAVFSLGATKAPGPDGFNGLFFQKNWDTVKEDLVVAVQEFFRHGGLPSDINETIVTLVPKV